MSEAVLYVEHSLVYSNKEPLPVKDVINSLVALNRISRNLLPAALSGLTDCKVQSVELLVEGLAYGSFKEQLWWRLLFKDEASLKDFLAKIRAGNLVGAYAALPGGDKPVLKGFTVGALVTALLAYGASYAFGTRDDQSAKPTIEANNNTIIVIGAEAYNVDPAEFRKVIEAAIGARKKDLATDAARVLAPAHREPGASVSLDGRTDLAFPPEVIREVPLDVDFEEKESTVSIADVEVDIRKTNRDSPDSGWTATLPTQFKNRVRLTFGNDVSHDALAGKLSVRAAVIVTYRKDGAKKQLKPTEIQIVHIHGGAAAPK